MKANHALPLVIENNLWGGREEEGDQERGFGSEGGLWRRMKKRSYLDLGIKRN